ncbi:hypothetical protein KP509_35G047800 [Ceratopteris richardii]|uniref:RING-type domain-containing protein n=1 Tax=Ceratopteris richardii TaxID=49495 RepID=A0A8T2QGN5_CERRI|nr:hypothetical protein KP509_35G047800 [Ceratopteris richardii]KAH7282799.1 hypothetical protein KP509_35G047800 [Ceratopteris richardii]
MALQSSRSFNAALFQNISFLLDGSNNQEEEEEDREATQLSGRGHASGSVSIAAGQTGRGFERLLTIQPAQNREVNGSKLDAHSILKACKEEKYQPKHRDFPSERGSDLTQCPICLENFEIHDKILRLPCNHPFHAHCIAPWINEKHDECPFCRSKILKSNTQISSITPNSSNRSSLYSNFENSGGQPYGRPRDAPLNITPTFQRSHTNRVIAPTYDRSTSMATRLLIPSSNNFVPNNNPLFVSTSGSHRFHIPIENSTSMRQSSMPDQRAPSTRASVYNQPVYEIRNSEVHGTSSRIGSIPISKFPSMRNYTQHMG